MPARRREPLAREEPAELQVAATNGSVVTDSRGRKYIDFVMGWCVGNFGWRPLAIGKALERFKGPDYVYPGLSIGASDNRERIRNLLPHCGKIAPPLDAKALRRIEQRLKRRDAAASVMEPISINLGVLIPERGVIR